MNFGSNSPSKTSSYPHRASYYSRSPHPTRPPFNTPYHPRLINTPPNVSYTGATATVSPPNPTAHNHIKKNYHFSAKSSELFIKKKASMSGSNVSRSTRFDAVPNNSPHGHVQLLSLGASTSTISFSSQHTPQSFIAKNNAVSAPNSSPHNTMSTVSSISSGISTEHRNKLSKNRKTRWNAKPTEDSKHGGKGCRERYVRSGHHSGYRSRRRRRHRDDDKESVSRSRSRSRTNKSHKKASKCLESENEDDDVDVDIDMNEYVLSQDIDEFLTKYRVNPKRKRNYAEEELQRIGRMNGSYLCRSRVADDGDDESKYNRDLNNSDYAMYEAPFQKPKFVHKLGAFTSSQRLASSVVSRFRKINKNLLISRSKKRKQRSEYILLDRSQSLHWKVAPTKCWFYRCVDMFEGHVMTMCSSPEFCGGVSYPRKPLDEIEKKLSRIHPLPTLIYQRLFRTLHNLSCLIRTHPCAVKWDRNKLLMIYEKAIRKQKQMMSIYDFADKALKFVQYDFAPFKLSEFERNHVSFYNMDDNVVPNDIDIASTKSKYNSMDDSTEYNKNNNINATNKDNLTMETPFDLNLDLVGYRKSSSAPDLYADDVDMNNFVISPAIERLVTANCVFMQRRKGNIERETPWPSMQGSGKRVLIKQCRKKSDYCNETHTDSNKEELLLQIAKNNGVYGAIAACGLTPTHSDLPTLYELPQRNVSCKRVANISYLMAKYVDATDAYYVALLLRYFVLIKCDPMNDKMSTALMRSAIHETLKHTFIGRDKSNKNIVMQMHVAMDNILYCVTCQLNPDKRHALLCTLLRLKKKHKNKNKAVCIPQPPPPHNTICVNFNWSGSCQATFCNKKHQCSCCGDKHPARICRKQCVDYNWAKCHRICPQNKKHCCSQCGHHKHSAWRCPYLHKSVTLRYYAIYKTKKIRNGYFKLLQKKEEKKNIEWINKKKLKQNK